MVRIIQWCSNASRQMLLFIERRFYFIFSMIDFGYLVKFNVGHCLSESSIRSDDDRWGRYSSNNGAFHCGSSSPWNNIYDGWWKEIYWIFNNCSWKMYWTTSYQSYEFCLWLLWSSNRTNRSCVDDKTCSNIRFFSFTDILFINK